MVETENGLLAARSRRITATVSVPIAVSVLLSACSAARIPTVASSIKAPAVSGPMLVIQGPVSLPGPLGGVWACRIAQRNSDGRYSDVELPWIVSSVMILADGQSVWEATAEPEDHGPWIVWHRFYEPGQHRITCRIFSGQSLAGQATLGVQVPVPGTP